MRSVEDLNKKLAEWAGFTIYLPMKHSVNWNYPNDRSVYVELPVFTESLDACFRWLVPKVIKSADYSIIITQDLARCVGYIRPTQGGAQYEAIDNQSPARALCLAIEKLIDGGIK